MPVILLECGNGAHNLNGFLGSVQNAVLAAGGGFYPKNGIGKEKVIRMIGAVKG